MLVKIENVEKNVVQLEIEVDAEKFEVGLQKSFVKNANRFNIPGFRKGKAPRHMVEKFYGEQTLYEDAINAVCPEEYDAVVEANNLNPVDRPEIDIKQIGKGKNLIFTAKVTVKPEVQLGQYKGVEVKKVEAVVTDEEVQMEMNKVLDKNSRLITIEDRPVQMGDTAVIDFEGFIDGIPFEGGKGEDFSLVIGSGSFIPGFEEQVVGMNKDQEADLNVTFPEDYGKDELAGKPTVFKVKVKEIKLKELPALDDEFAKDVSEFDTLEEYKADMKQKLTDKANDRAKRENEDSVINAAVEKATVEIPKVMIEKHIDNLTYDFSMRLRYQGLDLNQYLEMMGMDQNTFREQFTKRAESEVKTQLVVEAIGKAEDIKVTDEEIETEIKRLADNYKQSVEDFKKNLKDDDLNYIKNSLVAKNAIELLVSNALFV